MSVQEEKTDDLGSSITDLQQSMDDGELDTIAEQVVRFYMRKNFSRSPDSENVKEEFNYEEWGDVDAVKRLPSGGGGGSGAAAA